MQGISKSQVSRMCAELDKEVESFRTRKLSGAYPYVWLDATFVKVRDNGRVISQAIVIAIGVTASGEREVLGGGCVPGWVCPSAYEPGAGVATSRLTSVNATVSAGGLLLM